MSEISDASKPQTASNIEGKTKKSETEQKENRKSKRSSLDGKKSYSSVSFGSGVTAGRKSSTITQDSTGYPYYPKHKSSTSDDTKKKDDNLADPHEKEEKDRCSPRCYIIYLFISLIIMALIMAEFFFVHSRPYPKDTFTQKRIFSNEIQRKTLVLMSDNLDCSILMKRLFLKNIHVAPMLVSGVMCLYVTEPHSMAPDSAVSFLYYYQQGKTSLAKHDEMGYLENWDECYSTQGTKPNNSNCTMETFRRLATSFSTFNSNNTHLANCNLQSYAIFPWIKAYFGYYTRIFPLLSGVQDSGTPIFSNAQLVRGYNLTDLGADETTYRVLQVSKLNEKMIERYRPDMSKWDQVTGNTRNRNLVHGDKITMTKNLTRHLMQYFLFSNRVRGDVRGDINSAAVRKDNYVFELIYHKTTEQTSSVISAFIVKVVYEAFQSVDKKLFLSNGRVKETVFYGLLLSAQRYTYQTLPKTKEWNPRNKKRLRDYRHEVIEKLKAIKSFMTEGGIKMLKDVKKDELVTRKDADRVASIVSWRRQQGDFLTIFNFCLPRPFNSTYISGKPQKTTHASFFSKAAGTSVPFTSAASLILFERPPHMEAFDQENARFIATASGSIRTIEAVATTVLRFLIFDEEAGEAVYAPAAYVSLRDGTLRCEKDRFLKDGTTRFEEITVALENLVGISCQNVDKKSFEETDRVVMAVSRGRKKFDYMKASVDDRSKDYNYATGF